MTMTSDIIRPTAAAATKLRRGPIPVSLGLVFTVCKSCPSSQFSYRLTLCWNALSLSKLAANPRRDAQMLALRSDEIGRAHV